MRSRHVDTQHATQPRGPTVVGAQATALVADAVPLGAVCEAEALEHPCAAQSTATHALVSNARVVRDTCPPTPEQTTPSCWFGHYQRLCCISGVENTRKVRFGPQCTPCTQWYALRDVDVDISEMSLRDVDISEMLCQHRTLWDRDWAGS